mmetsp:Transcript_54079/g.79275  ORF Transcript_54079/g.79275 Transcript_54079/m.79275 type:complete len:135 (-) Transcript_54079:540-944(-)
MHCFAHTPFDLYYFVYCHLLHTQRAPAIQACVSHFSHVYVRLTPTDCAAVATHLRVVRPRTHTYTCNRVHSPAGLPPAQNLTTCSYLDGSEIEHIPRTYHSKNKFLGRDNGCSCLHSSPVVRGIGSCRPYTNCS